MSWEMVNAVINRSQAKGGALLVEMILANFSDDEGRSFPKVATLAKKARISERQVQRILRDLEDIGELETLPSKQAHWPNTYWLTPGGDILSPDTDVAPGATSTPGLGRRPDHPWDDGAVTPIEEPSVQSSEEPSSQSDRRPTASQLERERIDRVWDYYCEQIPNRRRLDDKRRRFIRNALKMFTEAEVKLAILGLSRSPWHNGDNKERKKYLDLHYALRGKGDESDDERIEKAITWAAVHAPGQSQLSQAQVDRHLDNIRYTMSLPHRPEAERGKESWRKLREAGFRIVALDKAPWARLER